MSGLHHLFQGKIQLLHGGSEKSIKRRITCDLSLYYSLTITATSWMFNVTERNKEKTTNASVYSCGWTKIREGGRTTSDMFAFSSFLPGLDSSRPGSFIKRAVSLSRIKERGGADLQHTQHQNSSFICLSRAKWKTLLAPNALFKLHRLLRIDSKGLRFFYNLYVYD